MSKVALADELAEWDGILAGLADIEALDKPDLQELAGKLTALVRAVRELSAEQAALEARRRSITQQLRVTRRLGRELAIKVKAAVKGVLGHRNELLSRFRVKPIRSRRKQEEVGIAQYPRPDLLAAAGLPQAFQPDPTPSEEN
jgi:chromosome segregation ATPase